MPVLGGVWGRDARHAYSKQQPWNADQSLLALRNKDGGTPSVVLLDGTTYEPVATPCAAFERYDWRWHPTRPNVQINVDKTGTRLEWFDVVNCTQLRTWTLPVTVDNLGSGEGNASHDGRFVALGNATQMFVVDMDPQPPFAPYPNRRIGPVYSIPACSLSTSNPSDCPIGNLSISPSGRFIDLKYSGSNSYTQDAHRIFAVDPSTLEIRVRNMASASLRCDSFAGRPNGWIYPLKHADLALNPFDGNQDVIIGGRSCPGSSLGRVTMVRLEDGLVTELTDPDNEASVYHVSARNTGRPGWVYVTYFKSDGRRFSDEVVAVKMDGSRSVERLAHTRSASSGCYRCEPHGVPSPDGRRVLFASNWARDCSSCGDPSEIKAYVVTNDATVDTAPAPSGPLGLALESVQPNPARGAFGVAFTLPTAEPARLELVDVAGRSVWRRDLSTAGAGRHHARFDGVRLRPGVYWVRLVQGGQSAGSKLVLIQ